MEQISTNVRRWGNSLGIILPNKVVQSERIKEGIRVNFTIQPQNKMTVRDVLQFSKENSLPKLKKSTAKLIKEAGKELWNE